ncbi:zinc finger protein 10 [Manihot esculenta]|uniref:C2H2-type domain-containing protein n=1 Tax=Manihot esculenta TaxID=3983 RepID=A0A2C9VKP0_MANES|nr:zinc finger protein 10 [Manihot esculenta]OAY46131.1 hypothetical protein MANES_07G119000v8 [Manihot esculenta]
MEQAQYLMLMKRTQFLNSNFHSWEEKAFAEDASRNLGGCIWPPRSYSCSFCKREFRSAQALGGHMNVHRRDRARLKQSLSPQNDVLHPLKSFDSHFPSEVFTLHCDNLDFNSGSSVVASTLASSRVSAMSGPENLSHLTFVSSHPCTITEEKRKVSSLIYDLSGSDSLGVLKNPGEEDSTSLNHEDFVETDFFMGFDSVVRRNPASDSHGDISCKRPNATAFMIKPCSSDRYTHQSPELIDLNSTSIEDIDLELRLGKPPKVK